MSKVLFCLIALALVCAPYGAAGQPKMDAEMSVVAEGSAAVSGNDVAKAEDEALSDAKRNAVEKAIGVFVKSESVGSNYQMVEESILTKSEGYIASWSKVEGSRKVEKVGNNELLSIKISAKVRLVSLIDAMTDIEEIYNSIQRPRIMVLISEQVDGKMTAELPVSANAIMRALQNKKFDVVDPEVMLRLLKKQSTRQVLDKGDARGASEIAIEEGAEVLVLGSARAMNGPSDMPGDVNCGNAVLNARMVYADTGEVIYTANQVSGRGASFGDISEAKVKALDDAGHRLISDNSERFIAQVIARWALELQNGRLMKVIAKNVSYEQFNAIKKSVRDFRGHVAFVGQPKYSGKTATIMVRTKLAPDEFRDRLSAMKLGKKRVEIEEASGAATYVKLK